MSTKTKNNLLMLVTIIIASAIPVIVFGKWKEAIVFILCHLFIRPQFKREYHNVIPDICRTITGCVLFFGISFVLPFEISLASAIPLTYLIGWVGCTRATSDYYQRKYEKLCEKCEKLQAEIKALLEQVNDPKEVILNSCRKAKLSKRDTEIAVKYYCEGWQPKDIWLWLCEHKEYESIEWDSVYHLLWKIGKKVK